MIMFITCYFHSLTKELNKCSQENKTITMTPVKIFFTYKEPFSSFLVYHDFYTSSIIRTDPNVWNNVIDILDVQNGNKTK